MKRTFIFSTTIVLSLLLIFSSCKSSRVWETKERNEQNIRTAPPPAPRNYTPTAQRYSTATLIISPRPGFTMNQYSDGQYYHRSPQGFLYWKGFDNRFYIDKSYLNRVSYTKWEYKDWKRYRKEASKNRR